ncbi:hypothetical protein [Amycolatopsis japonica]
MLGYTNPVNEFNIGDVVRFGNGKVEWTIVGKGATTGLSLRDAKGRKRGGQTFDVTLVRRSGVTSETEKR